MIKIIQVEIEEEWDEEWLNETDKAWDAIHRCLTDGKLEWTNGDFPLNAVIAGGRQLYQGDDRIMSIIAPEQVPIVAEALQAFDMATLRNGYEKIEQSNYDGEIGAEDFEYTWEYFKELPPLFSNAATAGRAVVFSVVQ